MTENEAKLKLCAWAESQVGTREGGDNWNEYANNPDLQRMYGWCPQNQPWCDVFVDVGFIECFGLENACAMTYQPMGAGSALCRQSAQYYKDHGAFSQRPEIGDQVFFYVSGDINHTGIVVSVDGGSVTTVEGNSSDMVARRVYSVGDTGRIAGYGRPNWSVVADNGFADDTVPTNTPESTEEARYYELRFPYLRRGSEGRSVAAAQLQLSAQGYDIGPDGADGDFGGNTERALQEFQADAGLKVDGVVGPDTGAVLYGAEVVNAVPVAKQETVGEEPSEAPNEPTDSAEPKWFWDGLISKLRKK